jgi:hypothetical protein
MPARDFPTLPPERVSLPIPAVRKFAIPSGPAQLGNSVETRHSPQAMTNGRIAAIAVTASARGRSPTLDPASATSDIEA